MSGPLFGSSWFGDVATFFGSDYLRDYQHAAKTFRTNGYQYTPKFKFLFHVYFEINPEAYSQNISTGTNFGLAVKTVKLPGFSFTTQDMNQYNRKRIIQTKIKYDPVNISFHDDNGNMIRNLWKAYYNYNYADGTKPKVVFAGARGANAGQPGTLATYNERTTYTPSITGNDDWGYIGETPNPGGHKIPFFKNITIFGFSRHNFVAYTLINPIINKFDHDTYNYSENGGIMEMQMTLDYETVVYNEGAIDGKSPSNIVAGFGLESNYDRTLSPIARPGSNSNILGQGGLVDSAGGLVDSIASGDYFKAFKDAGSIYYNYKKNPPTLNSVASEVVKAATNSVQNTPNTRNLLVYTPTAGQTPSYQLVAGAPTNAVASPAQIGPNPYAGKTNP
jgi:hypothetical protein